MKSSSPAMNGPERRAGRADGSSDNDEDNDIEEDE